MNRSSQPNLKTVEALHQPNKDFIEFRRLQHEDKARLLAGQAVPQASIQVAIPVSNRVQEIKASAALKSVEQALPRDDSASSSASTGAGYVRRNSIVFSVFAAIAVGVVLGTIWLSSGPDEAEYVADNSSTSEQSAAQLPAVKQASEQAVEKESLQQSADALHNEPVAKQAPVAAAQAPAQVDANVDANSNVDADVDANANVDANADANADVEQIANEVNSTKELIRQYKQELKRLNTQNVSLNSEVDARGKEAKSLNNELLQLGQALAAKQSAAQPKVETRTVYNFVNGAVSGNSSYIGRRPADFSADDLENGEIIVDDESEKIPVEWDSNGQPIVFVDAFSGD